MLKRIENKSLKWFFPSNVNVRGQLAQTDLPMQVVRKKRNRGNDVEEGFNNGRTFWRIDTGRHQLYNPAIN